jgi:hypothetical protein
MQATSIPENQPKKGRKPGTKNAYYMKYQVKTAREIANELGDITESGVEFVTRKAIGKLRRSPILFLQFMDMMASRRRSNNMGSMHSDEIYCSDMGE